MPFSLPVRVRASVPAELPASVRLPLYRSKGLSEFVRLPDSLAGKLFPHFRATLQALRRFQLLRNKNIALVRLTICALRELVTRFPWLTLLLELDKTVGA